MSVKRTSMWLPAENNESIFTWFHYAPDYTKSLAVLIVGPIGPEYMHCYRSVRCLADKLAESNILVARYDWPGMGDSSGDLEDSRIWSDWLNAPKVVSDFLCDELGVKEIVIVGLRSASLLLGSYLLSNKVKGVVYWYPILRGASFVRDVQALDSMLKLVNPLSSNTMNAGGYPLTETSQDELKAINLNKSDLKNIQHSLIIENSELPSNNKFCEYLLNNGVDVESVKLDGFTQMARQAALSVVPFDNLEYIKSWVFKQIENTQDLNKYSLKENGLVAENYTESIINAGGQNSLYGILTLPTAPSSQHDIPLLILSNAGVAHHIGPNRFHVDTARLLAKGGVATFRMDLSNLGESVDKYNNNAHHPYPLNAAKDINVAVDFLQAEYSFSKIILSGLCSGAHNVFHAATAGPSKISGLILINPLTFYWSPGQSIFVPEDARDEIDSVYYRSQILNFKKWLNLLFNPKKILSVVTFLYRVIRNILISKLKLIYNKAGLVKLGKLENDINNLFNAEVSISIIYSETDPGYSILMSQAGSIVRRGIRDKLFFSTLIKDADHTFSSRVSRKLLISSIISSVELMK